MELYCCIIKNQIDNPQQHLVEVDCCLFDCYATERDYYNEQELDKGVSYIGYGTKLYDQSDTKYHFFKRYKVYYEVKCECCYRITEGHIPYYDYNLFGLKYVSGFKTCSQCKRKTSHKLLSYTI